MEGVKVPTLEEFALLQLLIRIKEVCTMSWKIKILTESFLFLMAFFTLWVEVFLSVKWYKTNSQQSIWDFKETFKETVWTLSFAL